MMGVLGPSCVVAGSPTYGTLSSSVLLRVLCPPGGSPSRSGGTASSSSSREGPPLTDVIRAKGTGGPGRPGRAPPNGGVLPSSSRWEKRVRWRRSSVTGTT